MDLLGEIAPMFITDNLDLFGEIASMYRIVCFFGKDRESLVMIRCREILHGTCNIYFLYFGWANCLWDGTTCMSMFFLGIA